MAGTVLGAIRGKYKPKELKFEHVCENCGIIFKSADVKGRFCIECKKPKKCECGCGQTVKTVGHTLAFGCSVRGKSYKDIYGTKIPKCGFKKGNKNPMANPVILESVLSKINKGQLYDNIRFRSSYEVSIYKILKTLNISFEYEPIITTSDCRYYKPDFVINKRIFIEVSGYASASESGRERNLFKMKKLNKSYDVLIFITSSRFIPWYQEKIKSKKVILLKYEEIIKSNNILCQKLNTFLEN